MAPRLIFVHGIGAPRQAEQELATWTAALAEGARRAGHAAFASDLVSGSVDTDFAYYGDLFARPHSQGYGVEDLGSGEAQLVQQLLVDLIDEQMSDSEDLELCQTLRRALVEVQSPAEAQGVGEPVRRAINAATTLLSYGPLSRSGQWFGGKLLVRDLAQVARYLGRGEANEQAHALDVRIRQRLHRAFGGRSLVLVAHSLGSVVAWESLHEYGHEVPLFVTLGSPLAMRSVVWPHLVPAPPVTPPTVRKWLNFWDRDDIIVARPRLEADIQSNAGGVRPESHRTDSDGLWVHTATKYLQKPDVAGPVAEAMALAESSMLL
ncbi:hypothetical protein KBX53_00045 [Micromonospora sp. M51]|uniref:hypothetical protein n=1 Tax=Micromonospora sp. M51 TaxID=2824889 RepID=UPI001B390526|nr:hypothetical protein [Micromonospora sp. M51]MBQ1009371.1 hypothetical protein [Micromonospora sp. M51]